ncbi:Thioredoxin-related protein [Pandoraea pulmonicola]|uniref:Thioredoxin-related protein n=2 Tax=Pandoraea pulmonicola TaxID=93221 RepID=A0AAJ4ZC31_PANPU|nr:Thioredoxin-related protein [Pandoraea pulmonicola]
MLGFTAFVWAAPVAAAPGSPSSVATASAAGAPTLPSSSPAASTASARTSVVSPSVAPSPAATASAPSASPSYSNSVGAQSSTPRLAQATGVTFPREGTSAAPVNGKTAAQQQAAVPLATDFAAHARRAAALDAPLIVLVSLRDCVYCGPIRQRELAPLVRSGKYEVREIGMDSTAGVRDFDGSTTTGIAWARAHGVKVSPTVLFLDTHGRPVADPLIGAGLPDFYGAYLDDAIARGRARLHAGSGATTR